MKKRTDNKLRVFSAFILLVIVLTSAGMGGFDSVLAQDSPSLALNADLQTVLPPKPIEPDGTYSTRDLTYKWAQVTGATKYQYQAWKGSTKVLDKTVGPSACDTTYCTHNPGADLIDANYNWQVRVKVGDVWSDWSKLKWYAIKAGFDSQFTTDAAGWVPAYGWWTWSVVDGHYVTDGVIGKFTSTYFDQVYGIYTYEVKFRRQGSDMDIGSCFGIYLNGNPWPLYGPHKYWNKGYTFIITRAGLYSIWRENGDGTATNLMPWTDSGGLINSGWYNTLKVTYNRNTGFVQFFINGTRVVWGTYTTYKWGRVGIRMNKVFAGWEVLNTDWARLTPNAPLSQAESETEGGIFFDEASLVPQESGNSNFYVP